jgi:hypothetical protein
MTKDSGRVGGRRLITRRAIDRKTKTANFVATCAMRHKLNGVKIVEVGGVWFHAKRDGTYVAKFSSVGEAVAAL